MDRRTGEHDGDLAATEAEQFGSYVLRSTLVSDPLTRVQSAQPAPSAAGSARACLIQRLHAPHVSDAELRGLLITSGHVGRVASGANLVPISGVYLEPEPHLVMEHVEGVSVRTLLASAPRAELSRYLLPVLVDVLEGLRCLHELTAQDGSSAQLVHGAPSARHILVGHDGAGRLLDFTHVVAAALPWSPRRDEFLVPEEMAPEQALAPAHVDPRCDLFIAGAVLFEVLTGQSPFSGEGDHASLQNMLRRPIPLPSDVGSEAGRGFDQICMRSLQRARGERFGSAQEMAAALREEHQRSPLFVSREEVALWVQRIAKGRSREPSADAITTRIAMNGFGPTLVAERDVAPFRPARPVRSRAASAAELHSAAQLHASETRRMDDAVQASPRISIPAAAPITPAIDASDHASRSIDVLLAREVARLDPEAGRLPAPTFIHGHEREPAPERDAGLLDAPSSWRELQPSIAPASPQRRREPTGMSRMALSLAIGVLMASGLWFMGLEDPKGHSAAEDRVRPAAPPGPPARGAGELAPQEAAAGPESLLEALVRAEHAPESNAASAPAPHGRVPASGPSSSAKARAAARVSVRPKPAAVQPKSSALALPKQPSPLGPSQRVDSRVLSPAVDRALEPAERRDPREPDHGSIPSNPY